MAERSFTSRCPAGDVDRAGGFWSGLFGWRSAPSVMEGIDYRMFQPPRTRAARSCRRRSREPGLIVYLDTEDIDASIAKVRELGGTADDKQPVPTHGWFAACKDTEGNEFSLWQSDEPNAA